MNEDKNDIHSETTISSPTETPEQVENKTSIFNVTRRYKWIFALSSIIFIVTAILVYAKWNGVLGAEYWQMAIWGLCGLLAIYSILKKSLAALILNLILFFGISMIPAWGLVYKFFKPILELLTGTKLPDLGPTYHYW